MTKLRKFRTLEDKINLGLKIFCCLLILTIVLMGKSLAEYKQEVEIPFIRARVGKFKTNDIQLAMKLDGEEVEIPPSKDNYTVDISCDNADGSWDSDRWGANIDNIRAGKVKCEVNFTTPAPTISEVTATSEKTSIALSYTAGGIGTSTVCKYGTSEGNYENEVTEVQNTGCNITGLEMDTTYFYQVCAVNGGGEICKIGSIKTKELQLADNVELGDYISMTPTSTSYMPPSNLTGYSDSLQNTLNPSELNLWRVISKNSDGTVEMVSEYVSSKTVYFSGEQGYLNLVGGLNTIASQYTDGTHVLRTRHMGYSNQIEKCSGTLSYPYQGNCDADTGYDTDIDLVTSNIGTLNAYKPNTTTQVDYWLTSRYIDTNEKSGYINYSVFRMRNGSPSAHAVYQVLSTGYDYSGYNPNYPVRPIVTLKSNSGISGGNGTSAKPYTLK